MEYKVKNTLPKTADLYSNSSNIFVLLPDYEYVRINTGKKISDNLFMLTLLEYKELVVETDKEYTQFLIVLQSITKDLEIIEYHSNAYISSGKISFAPWLNASVEKRIQDWLIHLDILPSEVDLIEIEGLPGGWRIRGANNDPDENIWIIKNPSPQDFLLYLNPPKNIKSFSDISLLINIHKNHLISSISININIKDQISLLKKIYYREQVLKLDANNHILIIRSLPEYISLSSGIRGPSNTWILKPSDIHNGEVIAKYFKPSDINSYFTITIDAYDMETFEHLGQEKQILSFPKKAIKDYETLCVKCGKKQDISILDTPSLVISMPCSKSH